MRRFFGCNEHSTIDKYLFRWIKTKLSFLQFIFLFDKQFESYRYYYDKNIMTKVHGKRYAYKFDFQGLAAATQPTATDPAYKYQSDLFMTPYHHGTKLTSFMNPHHGITSSSCKYI